MARGEQSFSTVRALTRVDRLEDAEVEAERHRSRYLRLHPDEDGSWVHTCFVPGEGRVRGGPGGVG
jgi:hypothetical protein